MISDSTIHELRQFVEERGWGKYNTPDALAKSISIEAGELLECFQWEPDIAQPDTEHIKEELADVLIYCIDMADALDFDLDDVILSKLAKNKAKYPAKEVRGDFANYRDIHESYRKE